MADGCRRCAKQSSLQGGGLRGRHLCGVVCVGGGQQRSGILLQFRDDGILAVFDLNLPSAPLHVIV